MKMTIHTLVQGSPEWHAYRAQHFNASDAPAMLGVSPYKTRNQLLHELHTGITPEVDPAMQRLFDTGHAAEAAARPLAEEIIGEDLYPVVGSLGELSASYDGLTMDGRIVFEHKLMNLDLAQSLANGIIPDSYHPQMEQQLLVSGAAKVLFMATSADRTAMEHVWYTSNPELRAKIIAGWEQFAKDLSTYVAPAVMVDVVGHTPDTLPALHIEVAGMVTASNLAQYKEHALAVFGSINRELTTDQHFADAEKAVKWCADVESRLVAAKEHALSQTASIDQLFKAIDDISAEARRTRLELDKLVKARKEELRTSIVTDGVNALRAHVAELNVRIGKPYMPVVNADFAGSIKGKKSLDSMRSAVDTVLANGKIEANAIADKICTNLRYVLDTSPVPLSLLPDLQLICLKAPDDFVLLVKSRIDEEAKRVADMVEKERAAIQEQERIKAQAQVAAEAAKVARIVAAPDIAESELQNMRPCPVIGPVERITSAMRKALNEHLDALSDDELERVLRFCQSRYPLQAKAA